MQQSLVSENLFWLVKSNLSLATWLLSWKVSLEPWVICCEKKFDPGRFWLRANQPV